MGTAVPHTPTPANRLLWQRVRRIREVLLFLATTPSSSPFLGTERSVLVRYGSKESHCLTSILRKAISRRSDARQSHQKRPRSMPMALDWCNNLRPQPGAIASSGHESLFLNHNQFRPPVLGLSVFGVVRGNWLVSTIAFGG